MGNIYNYVWSQEKPIWPVRHVNTAYMFSAHTTPPFEYEPSHFEHWINQLFPLDLDPRPIAFFDPEAGTDKDPHKMLAMATQWHHLRGRLGWEAFIDFSYASWANYSKASHSAQKAWEINVWPILLAAPVVNGLSCTFYRNTGRGTLTLYQQLRRITAWSERVSSYLEPIATVAGRPKFRKVAVIGCRERDGSDPVTKEPYPVIPTHSLVEEAKEIQHMGLDVVIFGYEEDGIPPETVEAMVDLGLPSNL